MLRVVILILAILTGSSAASAREIVKVGGYEFGPFVDVVGGKPSGLTQALLDTLNHYQDRFSFEFVLTSPNRRYKDFEDHKFDLIFFESPDWGWSNKRIAVEASQVFLDGGERYIALAKPGRSKDYFASLGDKRMIGILGYHYGFAGFEADDTVMSTKFHTILVTDTGCEVLTGGDKAVSPRKP